jgi:FAD/FMN-containing dehydrogenase
VDPSTVRARLRDDLSRQFRGDLLIDGPSRTLYSTDSSLFLIEPLAVAIPRDEEDLRLLVRHAFDRALPIVPRGAGTGLAGSTTRFSGSF